MFVHCFGFCLSSFFLNEFSVSLSDSSGGGHMGTLLSPLSYSTSLYGFSFITLPSCFCYYNLTVESVISYNGFSNFAYSAH